MSNENTYFPAIGLKIYDYHTTGFQIKLVLYRVIFLTGPALKVLSVEDGKIPTKKSESSSFSVIPLRSLFW